jgi:hypothetical protein
MQRLIWAAAAIALMSPSVCGAQESGEKKVSRADLERKLEQTLSGSVMIGHFTVTGDKPGVSPKEERYTLKRVKKLEGDNWLFEARIQYGEHDRTLPLTLPVLWAGDTPVITLTKLPVPGFGTFTARVLIYDDQYAGTWSGGDHGGQLFGRIVRGDDANSQESATEKPAE